MIYSYIIARDYGFAPNPYFGYCTLATCKPLIRKNAKINDWILGTGSCKYKKQGYLVFAMKVTDKITFNAYWNDERFACKKPIMNGSRKLTYGDNIYYFDNTTKTWFQSDSHHSLEGGETNYHNLNRDTRYDSVLISNHFFYFGANTLQIPNLYQPKACHKGRGHKSFNLPEFITWLETNSAPGIHGVPELFRKFKRYEGKY